MKSLQRVILALFLAALALPCESLRAEGGAEGPSQVIINDTAGVTRAAAEVDGSGRIEFNVVDKDGLPADGVEVLLTSAATGEVISAIATNGAVAFEAVAPGAWTVASAVPGITFTNVAILPSTAALAAGGAGGLAAGGAGVSATGAGLSLAGAAGATAAVGGATALAVTTADDDNSSSKPPLSPST